MSTEQNKAIVRQFIEEGINRNDFSIGEALLSDSYIEHEELPPGVPSGVEGVKLLFTMMHNAVPDFHASINDIIAEGDKVVVFMTWTGTQQGELMGIPASGKQMAYNVIDIFRIVDGRVQEHWGVSDTMTMMQQLGAIPMPG